MNDYRDVSSAESVAVRLRWLREYLGMSQTEFAASLDVLPTLLNNWERARQRLSLNGALRINAIYGISLDFLFLDRREKLSPEMLRSLAFFAVANIDTE